MSENEEEPGATIHTPAWARARAGLALLTDGDARSLLASAMDQVESGWEALRGLQRLAERHPERERGPDDFGSLLTFAEAEVQQGFRAVAFDLGALVQAWPGDELPPGNDVEARLSEFGRYATVLVRATGAAIGLPEGFGETVRQVARLLPRGEWFGELSATLAAVEDVAGGVMNAEAACDAVHSLLRELPESARLHAGGLLVSDLKAAYAMAGEPPPPWLGVLHTYFGGTGERSVSPGGDPRRVKDG